MTSRRNFVKNTISLLATLGIVSPLQASINEVGDLQANNDLNFNADEDLARISVLLKGKDPVKWVFTGDSITQGAKHTFGFRSYQEIFAERVRWELGRVRDIVVNSAISGNTSRDILGDYEWRVAQFTPNIVSNMIGTNDVSIKKEISIDDFRKNNIALISRIRSTGSIPILHTPNSIIVEKATGRERFAAYVNVTREVADEKKVILIDHYAYWNDEIKKISKEQLYSKWMNDELHPNGYGHSQLAQLLFKKLSIFDENAFTCRDLNK